MIEKNSASLSMDTAKYIEKLHEDMPLNFDPLTMPIKSNVFNSRQLTPKKLDINAFE